MSDGRSISETWSSGAINSKKVLVLGVVPTLGVWGLPFSIVESLTCHHRPDSVTERPCEALAAVHAVDALVDCACHGERSEPPEARLDPGFFERARLGAEHGQRRARADEKMRDAELRGAMS